MDPLPEGTAGNFIELAPAATARDLIPRLATKHFLFADIEGYMPVIGDLGTAGAYGHLVRSCNG